MDSSREEPVRFEGKWSALPQCLDSVRENNPNSNYKARVPFEKQDTSESEPK